MFKKIKGFFLSLTLINKAMIILFTVVFIVSIFNHLISIISLALLSAYVIQKEIKSA